MSEINTEANCRYWRSQTKGEIVKLLGLEERGTVDYALPQDWVDELKRFTGIYAAHCFVWFYPNEGGCRIFGYPYPLTDEGRYLLKRYNERKGTFYPIN